MASYDPSAYDPAYTLLQKIKNIEKYLEEHSEAVSIKNLTIDENDHLIVTLTDGTIIDAGEINAGAGVVIDAALSPTSTNPVQNRLITGALQEKMENPMTSAGSIIYSGPYGAPMALAAGTPGQVLTMGASGVTPEWKTPESGGMTNPMTALGDLIVGGVDGDPVRMAKGTAQQYLRMNTAGTLPEWVTLPSYAINPMQAAGDLIVGGATGNPVRLSKGQYGQVLTSDTNGIVWRDATKLYEHNIYIYVLEQTSPTLTRVYLTFTMLSELSTPFADCLEIANELNLSGLTTTDQAPKSASGSYYINGGEHGIILGVAATADDKLALWTQQILSNNTSPSWPSTVGYSYTINNQYADVKDVVIAL